MATPAAGYALLIGINDYPNYPTTQLQGSVADVDCWEELCVFLDVPTVVALRSKGGKGANQADIVTALTNLLTWARTTKGEALLVYCGHGDVDVDKGEVTEVYLCPDDTDSATNPPGKRIPLSPILRDLDATGARTTIVLDTCFAGALPPMILVRSDAPDPPVLAAAPRALRAIAGPVMPWLPSILHKTPQGLPRFPNLAILAAGRQLAWEFPVADGWHGVYTWAACSLLRAFGDATTGPDRYVPISLRRLTQRVRQGVRMLAVPQHPVLVSQSKGSTMFLQDPATRDPIEIDGARGGHDIQLSGGHTPTGWTLFTLTGNGNQLVGYIVLTGELFQPQGNYRPGKEHWMVDLAKLQTRSSIAITTAINGQLPNPQPPTMRFWYVATEIDDGPRTGSMVDTKLVFIGPGPVGDPDAAFVLNPTEGHTTWLRRADQEYDPTGVTFTRKTNPGTPYAYSNKYFTRDGWGP